MDILKELGINSLAMETYMDCCEGMCKRVYTDIKNKFDNEEILKDAYETDRTQGAREYEYIIKLGELIKELEENCNNKYK